ncbi:MULTISPECIES: VWA domain-containing protein [unclassified Pseudonocardia]|uniref:MadC family VWA domain-containing protein n=1 Tax=unclassified Pseudonocardia TaxID=2619320 RepID=UPI0001FFE506|nr:VWA domain-containing protein [Pseudonocardia sp. Ae707_Ps1]OLM20977.1 carbon monoxide dehydrogenase E protein [Pseudonocardia sp. Ae707_Ps1]
MSTADGHAERLLSVLSAAFTRVLRAQRVAVSPAEAIEVRRVLAMIGATDTARLRAGLRAVTVKYSYERAGFERAFDAFFGLLPEPAGDGSASGGPGLRGPGAEGLPTDLDLTEDDDPLGRYADYDPNVADVGDMLDADEQEKGFNPHRDDDDVSLGGSDSELSVSSGEDRGRRGTTYTVDLERAGAAVGKELTSGATTQVSGEISFDDPEAILAWLAAYDPHAVYTDGPEGEELSEVQLGTLVEAIAEFVTQLAERVEAGEGERPDPAIDGTDGADRLDSADMQQACHELLHRMRGAPRRVPREHAHGPLDVRHTVRRSMRSDGVPFHLLHRAKVPDRVRLLVIADVSLSVRSITAFVLRLARTLHRQAFRCRVLAYVDSPVEVTELLLRAHDDHALAAVLAAPGIDLDATSDYGRVFTELNENFADAVDHRTAVLFVGDGRSNGLPPGTEELRTLARRAFRVGWITPEPGRYWNQASCAMEEYSEIVDHVLVAKDADDLLAGAGELGHALSRP